MSHDTQKPGETAIGFIFIYYYSEGSLMIYSFFGPGNCMASYSTYCISATWQSASSPSYSLHLPSWEEHDGKPWLRSTVTQLHHIWVSGVGVKVTSKIDDLHVDWPETGRKKHQKSKAIWEVSRLQSHVILSGGTWAIQVSLNGRLWFT